MAGGVMRDFLLQTIYTFYDTDSQKYILHAI